MNITHILLSITCFLMAFFFVKLITPVVMRVFITPLIRIGSYSVTALKGMFSPTSNASITSSDVPTNPAAFVFTSNPFAYFGAKIAGMHQSWTIWFNALIAGVVPMLDYAQANLPTLQPYLPANYYGWLMLAVIVGNIALRFKTFNSLAEKNAQSTVANNAQSPTV